MLFRSRYAEATPLMDESCRKIRRALSSLSNGTVSVLGGFIGSTPSGVTTTLGRNSSNLTAILVAAAVDADEVEIWTDVDGVYAHDPRLVTDQAPLEIVFFEDAVQMAALGAKVFHYGAVLLARQENVAIWIKNSRNPEAPGTKVCANESVVTKSTVKFFPQAAAAESGVA